MELPPPTPRLRVIQRSALALLVFAGVVNYIDRGTLSIANPLIRKELGLSLGDMGLLLSAFLWAYAFSQLPAGGLVDRLNLPAEWLRQRAHSRCLRVQVTIRHRPLLRWHEHDRDRVACGSLPRPGPSIR